MVGRILWHRHRLAPLRSTPLHAWRIRALSVCASTECELDRWLRQDPPGDGLEAQCSAITSRLCQPRAVVARQQRFGHGQLGRSWQSPPGGVWLSAALPWPEERQRAAAPALAVAVALAADLEAVGVPAALKWPNDLMLRTPSGPRKLAGLLPGLRQRGGRIRWARIGIGLNGCNPVPPGAACLVGYPQVRPGNTPLLVARVLIALEQAMALAAQPEMVRIAAERLLLPPPPQWLDGELWHPRGLTPDGGLRLVNGAGQQRTLLRF